MLFYIDQSTIILYNNYDQLILINKNKWLFREYHLKYMEKIKGASCIIQIKGIPRKKVEKKIPQCKIRLLTLTRLVKILLNREVSKMNCNTQNAKIASITEKTLI